MSFITSFGSDFNYVLHDGIGFSVAGAFENGEG